MAHVRKKLALRAGGLLRLFLGNFEFLYQRGQTLCVLLLHVPGGFQVIGVKLQVRFGASPLDELADLAADGIEHLHQFAFQFADLAAEKFNRAQHALARPNGKTKCGVQTFRFRQWRARKVLVVWHVRNPRRLSGRPHPSWKTPTSLKGDLASGADKLTKFHLR